MPEIYYFSFCLDGIQMACSCDNVRTRSGANRLQISSNFRPLRFPQSSGGFLTIRFANDPGVSDGQFLKTILTVNEFAEGYDTLFSEGAFSFILSLGSTEFHVECRIRSVGRITLCALICGASLCSEMGSCLQSKYNAYSRLTLGYNRIWSK